MGCELLEMTQAGWMVGDTGANARASHLCLALGGPQMFAGLGLCSTQVTALTTAETSLPASAPRTTAHLGRRLGGGMCLGFWCFICRVASQPPPSWRYLGLTWCTVGGKATVITVSGKIGGQERVKTPPRGQLCTAPGSR